MSFDRSYCEQIINAFLKHFEQKDTTVVMLSECTIEQLGEYICGLANLALYKKTPYAYALWGVSATDRTVTGTSFIPPTQSNLAAELSIKAVYSILATEIDGKNVVVLEVQRATNTTMHFNGIEYFIDNNKLKLLRDCSDDIEKQLWRNLDDQDSFEVRPAKSNVSAEDIVKLLDCQKLFEMLSIHYPNNPVKSEFVCKLL